MSLAAGERLGPYEIVSHLAKGGMGEVYTARDTRLDRLVAVKILPADLASSADARARFEREAKAIAALTHPHICTLHDVGHHGETAYLVMEFIGGETLAARLVRGPLTTAEALRYGIEIAGALAKAHEAGIVHRDLKPSNVMLTPDGHVKVMDFGVAKRIDTDAAASLPIVTVTATGELPGTFTYMSPEQLRGLPVDGRSDVFAFGVLLHEMVTGRHPFWRNSQISTIDAILNAPEPALETLASDTPPLLSHVVSRCLAKDREERYQSFRDVQIELSSLVRGTEPSGRALVPRPATRRWWWAAAAAIVVAGAALALQYRPALRVAQPAFAFKEREWVLIADFENLTEDKLFDRSLRAALEVGISQSPFVNVFPTNRVQETLKRMKRPAVDRVDEALAAEVAVREGLRAVVACSVAQVGNVYSLTARIVDPQSRVAVRTESVQAATKDQVLPALDDLATRLRRSLGESLAGMSQPPLPLPKATTASLEALKMYADGLALSSRDSASREAGELLRQAIALDPDFALAHAELGRRLYLNADAESRRQGEQHFVKALGLLDRLTMRERLWIAAVAEDSRGNRRGAVDAYKAYLNQYPGDPRGWFRLGWTQMAGLGQCEPAIDAFKQAIAIRSSDPSAHVNIATCYSARGSLEDAVKEYEGAFALDPELLTADFVNHEYGFTLVQAGRSDKASEVFGVMIANKEPRKKARGHRSLALLDMYRGRYTAAIAGLRSAIAINHGLKADVSEFRDRLFLLRAADAKGMAEVVTAELNAVGTIVAAASLGPEWLMKAAKIHARRGQVPEARRILARMSKAALDPTTGSSVSRNTADDTGNIDLVRAELELAERRPDRAVALLDPLVAADPRDSEALESLAHALVAAGRLEEGARRYDQLIARRHLGNEGQEDWLRAHVQRGVVYERLGRADAARRSYGDLLTIWQGADVDLVALKNAAARHAALNGVAAR